MNETEKDVTVLQSAIVKFAGNTFDDIPVILQYESTPLLWLTDVLHGRLETRAKIHNRDGVYIAKLKGRYLFKTADGEKSNLKERHGDGFFALTLDDKPLVELRRTSPALEVQTELYAPSGTLLVARPMPLSAATSNIVEKIILRPPVQGITLAGWSIGVHVWANGKVAFGSSFDSVFDDPTDKAMSRLGHDGKPID